jgi:hypothetical protein
MINETVKDSCCWPDLDDLKKELRKLLGVEK